MTLLRLLIACAPADDACPAAFPEVVGFDETFAARIETVWHTFAEELQRPMPCIPEIINRPFEYTGGYTANKNILINMFKIDDIHEFDRTLRHELCHAIDDQWGLITNEDPTLPVYGRPYLPADQLARSRGESFAFLCEMGRDNLSYLHDLDHHCVNDGSERILRLLAEEVFRPPEDPFPKVAVGPVQALDPSPLDWLELRPNWVWAPLVDDTTARVVVNHSFPLDESMDANSINGLDLVNGRWLPPSYVKTVHGRPSRSRSLRQRGQWDLTRYSWYGEHVITYMTLALPTGRNVTVLGGFPDADGYPTVLADTCLLADDAFLDSRPGFAWLLGAALEGIQWTRVDALFDHVDVPRWRDPSLLTPEP